MAQKYYRGDLVKIKYGVGYIAEVYTWKDIIEEMNSFEAVNFTDRCKEVFGEKYREEWYKLNVVIDGKDHYVETPHVEMVEQRPRG